MATHFLYEHLPASGLGVREPLRPYSTGGFGGVRYLQYLISIADMLLYQATLTDNHLVSSLLADKAVRVAAAVEAIAAVLAETETVVDLSSTGGRLDVDDVSTRLSSGDTSDSATMLVREAAATMVDRATVVTLTDRKVR